MGYSHARFQSGEMLAGAITASFETILSLSHDAVGIFILNSLDEEVAVVIPASNSDSSTLILAAGEPLIFNVHAMGRMIQAGDIQVKYTSAAPTTGSLRISAVK